MKYLEESFIVFALIVCVFLVINFKKHPLKDFDKKKFTQFSIIGIIVYFFDSLGIGSFATSTAVYKWLKLVPIKTLPGTLNVGSIFPVLAEALIYTTIFQVDVLTVTLFIIASGIGAMIGTKVVKNSSSKRIAMVMGILLIFVSVVLCIKEIGVLNIISADNTEIGFRGYKLFIGIVGIFVFGFLNNFGIGTYAPNMTILLLLGASPTIIFPVITACGIFCQMGSSINFIRYNLYDKTAIIANSIFGLIGVLIATYIVSHIRIDFLMYLVIPVIFVTGVSFLLKKK
jgi:uncharacterized membrane protein YfcA